MICSHIVRYLESHKRLVVPSLGAFVRREPGGELHFVELLKRDDGVLLSLLQADGMSQIEAAGAIDRFVFEVRHALQQEKSCRLEGLGKLTLGADGLLEFRYDPGEGSRAAGAASEGEPGRDPVPAQASAQDRIPEPKVSVSPSIQPEPYVKGLRYGKPVKNPDIRYVRQGRRRIDRFVLLAIIAGLLAVGAIVYGYLVNRNVEQIRPPVHSESPEALPSPGQTAAGPQQQL